MTTIQIKFKSSLVTCDIYPYALKIKILYLQRNPKSLTRFTGFTVYFVRYSRSVLTVAIRTLRGITSGRTSTRIFTCPVTCRLYLHVLVTW